jgi:hypothetical protein
VQRSGAKCSSGGGCVCAETSCVVVGGWPTCCPRERAPNLIPRHQSSAHCTRSALDRRNENHTWGVVLGGVGMVADKPRGSAPALDGTTHRGLWASIPTEKAARGKEKSERELQNFDLRSAARGGKRRRRRKRRGAASAPKIGVAAPIAVGEPLRWRFFGGSGRFLGSTVWAIQTC